MYSMKMNSLETILEELRDKSVPQRFCVGCNTTYNVMWINPDDETEGWCTDCNSEEKHKNEI